MLAVLEYVNTSTRDEVQRKERETTEYFLRQLTQHCCTNALHKTYPWQIHHWVLQ